jgi:hypothetical protein
LVPVVASNRAPVPVLIAVTFRLGTAAFEAVETMPAMVPPTDGGFGPVSMTGPGWQPIDVNRLTASRVWNSLMMRLD